jgi:hypothetical protein
MTMRGGGDKISFYSNMWGCLSGLGLANTCWYRCVSCWPVSIVSSESAVWLALVGRSMHVLGFTGFFVEFFILCSNPVRPFGMSGGPGCGIL